MYLPQENLIQNGLCSYCKKSNYRSRSYKSGDFSNNQHHKGTKYARKQKLSLEKPRNAFNHELYLLELFFSKISQGMKFDGRFCQHLLSWRRNLPFPDLCVRLAGAGNYAISGHSATQL